MKFTVTRPVKLQTPSGPKLYQPGETFQADPVKAKPFVERGLLRLVEGEDPFKRGFDAINTRLKDTFHVWSSGSRKEAILSALSRWTPPGPPPTSPSAPQGAP